MSKINEEFAFENENGGESKNSSENSKFSVFRILIIGNSWNFSNWIFLEFSKLEICDIFQLRK